MSSSTDASTQSFRVPNDLARRYLSVNAGITLKPTTVSSYDSHLTDYVTHLHDLEESVVSAAFTDVLTFIEECVRRGNRKSTITGKLTTIAELYRFIRLRTDAGGDLNIDPLRFREIDLEKYNTPAEMEREALSREELRRLFDAFESYRNRLMAIVGVETGLRNSDIRNLRTQDVGNDLIHVQNPKNSKPYDVPISDQLAFEFEVWFDNHRPGFTAGSDSEYVFPSQQGNRLTNNGSLNTVVKEAAERAGIQEVIGRSPICDDEQAILNTEKDYREWKRVTVHTLRHSYITLLEEAGVSLPYRQLVANHADPSTTLGYSHAGDVFGDIRDRYNPPR